MAHNLTQREDGKVEFAFAGDKAWHGLGQELTEGATIEQWIQEAGLEWSILESPVSFEAVHPEFGTLNRFYPNRKALFRSDNLKPLSVVSELYQTVQPREVLEFFRDLTETHGFKLSAAGSLFGGTRFWATAKTGMDSYIEDRGDTVEAYLLLISSADSSLATTAKLASTRVVCHNTMQIALGEKGRDVVKVPHIKLFDPKEVKIDIGVLERGWENYLDNLRKLSAKPLKKADALEIFKGLEFDVGAGEEPAKKQIQLVDDLFTLYQNGAGAGYCSGNLMGVLNAYTNYYTHGKSGKKMNSSSGFWSSYLGESSKIKVQVMNELLEMA